MRPVYRALILQFSSTGHDNTTSPIGAWGYYLFYKTYVKSLGAMKHNKDGLKTLQIGITALADFTVSGAYKIGREIQQ